MRKNRWVLIKLTSNRLAVCLFMFCMFVFCSVTHSQVTCESFIKNCLDGKQSCIDSSVKFCQTKTQAEQLYGEFHGGPVIIEGIFSNQARKYPVSDKKTLPEKKNTSAISVVEQKRPETAKAAIQQEITKEDKKISDSHTKKALVRLKLEDYDGVIQHASKAIQYYKFNNQAYRLRIIANSERNNHEDVISDCDFYLKIIPDDADVYVYKAFALFQMGSTVKANKTVNTAIELNPNLAFAYYVRSKTFFAIEDYSQMLEDMYFAAKLDLKYTDEFFELYKKYKKSATTFRYSGNLTDKKQKEEKISKIKITVAVGFIVFVLISAVVIYFVLKRKSPKSGETPKMLLKQFKILSKIAEGGMGVIYEGLDTVLNRPVAIKQLRTDFNVNSESRKQMLAEARMVASLKHPNILEIHSVFEEDNNLYLIFELVKGQTLQEKISIQGAMPLEKVKPIFQGICKALQYAHEHNIIHRDLKPSNVMISKENVVKVMDFGIAKEIDKNAAKTASGTPAYMPPEQGKGIVRKESDIYALGVCLYEALTGHVPWEFDGYDAKNNQIVPPSHIIGTLPQRVDTLIEMSVNEDIDKRIQTATEFCRILESITS